MGFSSSTKTYQSGGHEDVTDLRVGVLRQRKIGGYSLLWDHHSDKLPYEGFGTRPPGGHQLEDLGLSHMTLTKPKGVFGIECFNMRTYGSHHVHSELITQGLDH